MSRKNFVPKEFAANAFEDRPIPLPENQTTSQPSLIAFILDKLDVSEGQKVLEVGTGFGFQTALLSELAGEKGLVVSIEFFPSLFKEAKARLKERKNVFLLQGDGKNGFPEKAPFDSMVVSAACDVLPPELFKQLKTGGKIIYPKNTSFGQQLVLVEKNLLGSNEMPLFPVSFVPLR